MVLMQRKRDLNDIKWGDKVIKTNSSTVGLHYNNMYCQRLRYCFSGSHFLANIANWSTLKKLL